MRYFLLIFLSIGTIIATKAQPTAGTTGLLNIPTAEMQPDGTFMFGGNYLPEAMNPEKILYNTGNYYINITFLPFWEVCYRCTLLKLSTGTYNQDRSVSLRGRILRERRYVPSLVVGGNDIYTSSEEGNQYFGSLYIVTTKNFEYKKNSLSATLGYNFDAFHCDQSSGFFGGLAFSPVFFKPLSIIAEYDTKALSAGGSLLLFNHLYLYAFSYDMRYFSGGIAYKVYLKK